MSIPIHLFWRATLSVCIASSAIALPSDPARADWYEVTKDALQQAGNAVRANTVGRLAGQELVGDLSMDQLNDYKAKYGGDYHAKVTDWCNNIVAGRLGDAVPPAIPGFDSTWREENNKINCYWRKFGAN